MMKKGSICSTRNKVRKSRVTLLTYHVKDGLKMGRKGKISQHSSLTYTNSRTHFFLCDVVISLVAGIDKFNGALKPANGLQINKTTE